MSSATPCSTSSRTSSSAASSNCSPTAGSAPSSCPTNTSSAISKEQVTRLREAVSKDAEGSIRKFIEARTESLGLMPLIEQLKQIDTPEKLRATSIKAVVGLAERLTGDAVDKILASPEAGKVIKELNEIANGIDKILTKFNDVVTKALNAQGRFELSYAYQRVREGHKLVDVQIHVAHPDARGASRHTSCIAMPRAASSARY